VHRRFILPALALLGCLAAQPAHAQETALDALRAAARGAPRDYDAQLALGRALLEAGRHSEAAAQLGRAAGLRRRDAASLYELVRVDLAQRNPQRARGQCRAIARTDAVLGRVCQARAFLAWNRSSRAFEELQAALQDSPESFEALLALGDAHRLRAEGAEAEAAYRRAISANGQSAEPHLGLGQLFAQLNRRDDALAALRRAHELAPDDPDVDYELGRLLGGEDGIARLREAVANRPNWALAHAARGDALLRAGQAEPAVEAYRAALGRDATLAAARSGLGRALMAAGQLEQAEATLREALSQVANDASAATALADVLARTARAEEAYEQYRHASDLDPRNPEPLLQAAELALSQQRPVLAAGFLQRVLATHPNHAAALAAMGDVARAQRQTEQARAYYQRALSGEGPLDRARVQRALGELR
jgi:tetratricopeptide (TPR) repeat protein